MTQILQRMLRTYLLKISWSRLQVNTSGVMARHNYGISMSDEIYEAVAETSLVEESFSVSKPPVQQSGAPAYDADTVYLPTEKQDKITRLDDSKNGATIPRKSFTDPRNEKLSPPVEGSPPVPITHGPPDVLDPPPPPYSPPNKVIVNFETRKNLNIVTPGIANDAISL